MAVKQAAVDVAAQVAAVVPPLAAQVLVVERCAVRRWGGAICTLRVGDVEALPRSQALELVALGHAAADGWTPEPDELREAARRMARWLEEQRAQNDPLLSVPARRRRVERVVTLLEQLG